MIYFIVVSLTTKFLFSVIGSTTMAIMTANTFEVDVSEGNLNSIILFFVVINAIGFFYDKTTRHYIQEKENKIKAENSWKRILCIMPDGVAILNKEGELMFSNRLLS